MPSTIFFDSDSIKGYYIWVASLDLLDFGYIYARLYRKIMECDDAVDISKYRFSCGINVPYDDIDTLIIIDDCIPVIGIPDRVRILSMTKLEARGYIRSYPQLVETDFKILKLIEKVFLASPELFNLTEKDCQLLKIRKFYRQDLQKND